MTADALLPVGRDCDCGNPLVWRAGQQWCSVYGSHPEPTTRFVFMRNLDAPGAELIELVMRAPNMTRNAVRKRHLRAVS